MKSYSKIIDIIITGIKSKHFCDAGTKQITIDMYGNVHYLFRWKNLVWGALLKITI